MSVNFLKLSLFSIILGAVIGLLLALLLKICNLNYDPVKECIVILISAFLSYHLAEGLKLSGIISMFSSGLFIAHYAYWNISKRARVGSKVVVEVSSGLCQSFLYVYMGLTAFSIEEQFVRKELVMITLTAIFICRVFSVGIPIFLVYITQGCKPLNLTMKEWLFVYFGGLIRGAIAFGLSLQITTPNH